MPQEGEEVQLAGFPPTGIKKGSSLPQAGNLWVAASGRRTKKMPLGSLSASPVFGGTVPCLGEKEREAWGCEERASLPAPPPNSLREKVAGFAFPSPQPFALLPKQL